MEERVCPVWIGYILLNPLRKLLENPERLLGPHVRPGMLVLDLGSAMGFFSLPLARLVGDAGKVLCLDVQQGMLDRLQRRAASAGLAGRIEARLCPARGLGLEQYRGKLDFATAIHVLHEVPDVPFTMAQVHDLLKPGAKLLILEPKGHVTESDFADTLAAAERAGFKRSELPRKPRGHGALLIKPA